ncbi:MAG TPA: T9SS type A sorting domain-containing protein [Bacteroidia bacterium]|jgi:hypothetical protein|nr:T9SS type A sorting domain-containing protein [Bacteroidia bacterium]
MKKGFLLFLFFLSSFVLHAQSTWLWAESFPTTNISEGTCIAKDDSGNVIMGGAFSDTMTIGNTTLMGNPNEYNLLVAKFDANGNPIWSKTCLPGSSSFVYGIQADHSGNIYICGEFGGSQMTIGNITITNGTPGQFEIFIMKFDRLGNIVWAHSSGGIYNDQASSITIDQNGYVYVSGYFESNSIVFGQDTLHAISILGSQKNFFLVKYDQSGNEIWAKCGTGHAWVGDSHVAADSVGNIYLTGYYLGTDLEFEGDSLTQAVYNHCEVFLTRYTTSGNELWTKQWENDLGNLSSDICTDHANNIILCGMFDSVPQHFDNYTCIPGGRTNAYLLKVNPSGAVQWVVAPQAHDELFGENVAIDRNNEIFLTGGVLLQHDSLLIFGTDTFYYAVNTPDPAFLMLFNSSGALQCGQTIISGGDDFLAMVEGEFPGSVYLTGDLYMSPVPFGNDTLMSYGTWEYACLLNWGCGKINPETVPESKNANSFSIFPDPAANEICIASNPFLIGTRYSIYDPAGRLIHEGMIEGEKQMIDVHDLSPGIYFVQMISKDGNAASQKFVKE